MPMHRLCIAVVLAGLGVIGIRGGQMPALADRPAPSIYPIAWEFDFEYDQPRRILVQDPLSPEPRAYWYMTYTVTNNTDQERMFFPHFEMMTEDGRVIRSDRNIPLAVFEAIRAREGKEFLEHAFQIAGVLRIGEDQARDGVAIWEEPTPRMGNFSIFIQGLSGETALARDADGQNVILRKTRHLQYHVPGDARYVGDAEVRELREEWIMR